jgi:hypothetical protein
MHPISPPSLSPDSGGEDKGEGDNVAPIFGPLFMQEFLGFGITGYWKSETILLPLIIGLCYKRKIDSQKDWRIP